MQYAHFIDKEFQVQQVEYYVHIETQGYVAKLPVYNVMVKLIAGIEYEGFSVFPA